MAVSERPAINQTPSGTATATAYQITPIPLPPSYQRRTCSSESAPQIKYDGGL